MKYTDNQAIFASGTGFPDYVANGRAYKNNQANNMYIFPGLELGVLLVKTKTINDSLVYTAAKNLAESLNEAEKKENLLYPNLTKLQIVSKRISSIIQQTFKVKS